MTDILLDNELQAALHHARARRKSFARPTKGLTRTVEFDSASGNIDTNAMFPLSVRQEPITFSIGILITDASPTGVILELGSSTSGLKIGLNAGVLFVAAGNGVAATTNGIDGTFDLSDLFVADSEHLITVGVLPGTGQVRVWVDGTMLLRMEHNPLTAMLNGVSFDDAAGSFMSAVNGTSNSRSASNVDTAPSNFELAEKLSVFYRQIPRQFNNYVSSL